ncbi:acetolactate synthase large subunit, partial [bacterium]|nr:acetolactate synthase large subunit [bacterium]
LALPGRKVVCFSGDGSLLMNIQELATAAEENLDVKVVLMNNARLGLVRQQQELFYGARFSASQFFAEPDFVRIAEGFGVAACDLGTAEDPLEILEGALREPGPCLIHVPVAPDETVFPMVPPGAANRDMIGGEAHVCARN